MTTPSSGTPTIRLTLGFFEDFNTVAGLLHDTGARRVGSRVFEIAGDMNVHQTAALVELLEYSHNDANMPVKVEILPEPDRRRHVVRSEQLYDWWGTVADWRRPQAGSGD